MPASRLLGVADRGVVQPELDHLRESANFLETRIGDARITEIQFPQVLERLEVFHPGIRNARARQVEFLHVFQSAQLRHAGVGDRGRIEMENDKIGQLSDVLQTGVRDLVPADVDFNQPRNEFELLQAGVGGLRRIQANFLQALEWPSSFKPVSVTWVRRRFSSVRFLTAASR